MGSLCCCFRAPPELYEESVDSDDEEITESSSTTNRSAHDHVNSFVQSLTNKCEAVFGRGGMQPVSSSDQGPSSSQSTVAQGSLPGPSGSISSGNGTSIMRREKGVNSSRVEPEPVNEGDVQLIPHGGGSKECHLEVPVKVVVDKVSSQVCIFSVDEEDVCPICLEEYTSENPRIVTKCSHHYHLGCIYEWKERSEICPVCSKLMVFEEMT